MNKVKCVVLNNQNFENVKKNLEEKLEIYELQTYFPILSLFFRFYNNSNKNFTMKMNNYIVDIKGLMNIFVGLKIPRNFIPCEFDSRPRYIILPSHPSEIPFLTQLSQIPHSHNLSEFINIYRKIGQNRE